MNNRIEDPVIDRFQLYWAKWFLDKSQSIAEIGAETTRKLGGNESINSKKISSKVSDFKPNDFIQITTILNYTYKKEILKIDFDISSDEPKYPRILQIQGETLENSGLEI